MTAASKRAASAPIRNARLAKIHIAKKELRLDDAAYRAVIGRLFPGKSSSAQLSDRQLDELLEHFKAEGFKPAKSRPVRSGRRPMADGEQARKLRALWLSLYHLGEVRNPTEDALAAYVKRTTRVAALQWLDVDSASKAIEGLKKMAERAGVDWSRDGLGQWEPYLPAASHEPFAVVSAQWRRLAELSATQNPKARWWGVAIAATAKTAPHEYAPEDWHRVMEWFGKAIRQAQARVGS